MIRSVGLATLASCLGAFALPADAQSSRDALEGSIASHAAAEGVPTSLVHRVIRRESNYNPHLVGRGGATGLMQIKLATARGMGYTGSAAGLLDPETNMTYAVKYLAGAYRAAGGNQDRAVGLYARGYYYETKRQRLADAGSPFGNDLASARGPFGTSNFSNNFTQNYASFTPTRVSYARPHQSRRERRMAERAWQQARQNDPLAVLFRPSR
jgi:soluble lytic murein transglycosylase-like protein